MKKRVVIRAEGGTEKGLGHIIRCIALAEMLCTEYEILFLTNYLSPDIVFLLRNAGAVYIKTNSFQDAVSEWAQLQPHLLTGDIVVFDGYCFVTDIQQMVKTAGFPLVCIDDIHAFPFVADVVINHAGGFSEKDYQLSTETVLYCGMEYGLVREPFRNAAMLKKNILLNNDCLICFGGADPANDTLHTIEWLCQIQPGLQLHVVTGSAYRYANTLAGYKNKPGIQFYSQLDATALCILMQQCSMAITSPSTTSYEYLSVKGLLYLKIIATNQERMFKYLTENRLALSVESFGKHINPLAEIDTVGLNRIFDGKQQERFLNMFKKL